MTSPSSSLYEKLFPLNTVMKQRMVENFNGDALDTDRWTTSQYNTTYMTFRTSDTINGGFEMVTPASNNTGGNITFGNVARQYSETGSVFICVAKGSDSLTENFQGFVKDHVTWNTYRNMATIGNVPNEGVLFSHTSNASADTQVSCGATFHATEALYKIECKQTLVEYGTNGTIGATVTSTLPVVPMQPRFGVRSLSAAIHTGRCTYLECYNT